MAVAADVDLPMVNQLIIHSTVMEKWLSTEVLSSIWVQLLICQKY